MTVRLLDLLGVAWRRAGWSWPRPVACLLLSLVTPLALATVQVTDDRGRLVSLNAPALRIVTLLPSLTETVCSLQACDRLIGTDRWSDWPASVRALPKLGGLEDLQVETLVRLKPDVVLAAKSTRGLDRLEALGLKVLALDSDTHADLRRSLQVITAVLGQPQQGELAWRAVQQQIDAAAAAIPAAWRQRSVYVEIGGGPFAAGRSSFIGETIARLGLDNVVPKSLGPFPKLSPEFVLKARPELVVITEKEAPRLATRPGWQQLPAIKSGAVCRFARIDWDLLVRPSLRMGEAAMLLARCIQGLPTPTLPSVAAR